MTELTDHLLASERKPGVDGPHGSGTHLSDAAIFGYGTPETMPLGTAGASDQGYDEDDPGG